MSTPTVADVLRLLPPEWEGTEHGRRSAQYIDMFANYGVGGVAIHAVHSATDVFSGVNLAHWADHLRAHVSPATVNRHVAAVLSVWRRAHRRGLLGPPPGGMYQREPRGRRRVLSPEEEPRLLAALAEPYRSLAQFLLASGLRVGEALALEWNDIVAHGGVLWGGPIAERNITVRDSKNGDARVVPGVWVAFLPHLGSNMMGYTPDGPFKGISHSAFNHAFRAAKAAIGLENDHELVPHSLRHTYATRMVVAGVPLAVVARLLGHRTVRTTQRYAHVSDQDAERWVQLVQKGWPK